MGTDEAGLLPVRIFNIYPYAEAQQGTGGIQNFLVFLKGESSRVVPITIGHFEGQALVMALRKIPLPRPLPHNLLQNLLEKMHASVQRLVIHTLKDDVFHAHLMIRTPDDTFYLDCRPSDGMILATLLGTPVYISPAVMEEAGRDLELDPTGGVGGETEPRTPETVGVETEASGPAGEPGADPLDAESGAAAADGPELTELERLNVQLTRLIAEEAYEEAARVRDQIRHLEEDE